MNLNDPATLIELRLARLERAVTDAHLYIELPDYAPDTLRLNGETFRAHRSGVTGNFYWESEGFHRA